MELKHIKTFVTVADTLSFSRASEILYISQSAISKQISTLETDLNARLLQRDTHSVLLTDVGAAFLGQAHEILALCDRAKEIARHPDGTRQTSVFRIVIDACYEATSRITGFVLTCVNRMQELYPDVEVKCTSTDNLSVSQALFTNSADIVIMMNEMADREQMSDTVLNAKPFFRDSTAVICGNHDQSITESNLFEKLKAMNQVYLMDRLASMPVATKMLDFLGFHPKIKFCSSYFYLLSQVTNGTGFTLAPMEEFHDLNCPFLSAFPVPNREPQTIGVIRWKRADINPNIQRFCSIVDDLSHEMPDPTLRPFVEFEK